MSSTLPQISVIMPVYNSNQFLEESISSILNQTYKKFELLIIDDGSKDQSLRTIKTFKDSRIRLISHKTNRGIVDSLNEGIAMSRGEYIIRMDADDISLPNRFETQVNFMKNNPKVGVCGSWIEVFGKYNYIWKTPVTDSEIKLKLFFESAIAHPSVCIRKSVLVNNNLRYDSKFQYAEDYMLWYKISKVSLLANIPKVLLKYRTHRAQIGSRLKTKQVNINNLIKKHILSELISSPTDSMVSLHSKAVTWFKNADYFMLFKIKAWYKILIKANNKKHLYISNIFKNILSDHWIAICYLSKLGWKKYLYVFTYPELAIRGYARLIKRKLGYV